MSIKQKKPLSSDELRRAFMSFIGVGVIWIFFGGYIGFDAFIMVLGASGIMGGYIILYHAKMSSEAVRDQFADSLYYMGFLMTIASLIASLLSFQATGQALKAEQLLAQFGIALITTLIGLTGRIYFAHFSYTPEKAVAEAQASLVDQTNAYVRELELSMDAISRLRVNLENDIEKYSETASQLLNSLSVTAHEELRAVSMETRRELSETIAGLKTDFSKSRRAVQGFASKVENISVRDFEFKEVFSEPLAAIVSEISTLKDQITLLGRSAETTAVSLREAPAAVDELRSKLDVEFDLGKNVNEVKEKFSELANAIETISESIRGLSTHAEKSLEVSDSAALRMGKLADSLKSDTDAIAELKRQLAQEFRDAAEASTILVKALREGGEFLLERLGEDKADAPPSIGGTNLSTERSSAEPRESGVDIAQGTAIQLSGSDVNDSPDTDVQPTKPVVQT